jgi:hypothetical protein
MIRVLVRRSRNVGHTRLHISEPQRETARQPGVVRAFGNYPSRARIRFYFGRLTTNTGDLNCSQAPIRPQQFAAG